MVSCVVNVLDTTTPSVVAGSAPASARSSSTGSMLATNRMSSTPSPKASASRRGPRSEPPVPRLTIRLNCFPSRIDFASEVIFRKFNFTSSGAPSPARSAVWVTARFSVVLMASPANSAARHASKPRSAASCASSRSVNAPTRWRE
jgi:hypothetical protein